MTYPTIEQVNQASVEQLARWYRFLPSPGDTGFTHEAFRRNLEHEAPIMDRIVERFEGLGGFTPELSKLIGWESDVPTSQPEPPVGWGAVGFTSHIVVGKRLWRVDGDVWLHECTFTTCVNLVPQPGTVESTDGVTYDYTSLQDENGEPITP